MKVEESGGLLDYINQLVGETFADGAWCLAVGQLDSAQHPFTPYVL
eukprot:COSAG02_NODE_28481_length_588_cov_3.057260_2_plen_45_part_01